MNKLIEALQIFAKVDSVANSKYPTHCEHDVLHVMADPKDYSEADLKCLNELGFIPDDDGRFISYSFGSA